MWGYNCDVIVVKFYQIFFPTEENDNAVLVDEVHDHERKKKTETSTTKDNIL